MNNQRRLGRGLEALLGRPNRETDEAPQAAPQAQPELRVVDPDNSPPASVAGSSLEEISVYEIDNNPFQPRQEFNAAELDSLAESIKEHGLLQPIVVRRVNDRYQLIAGERRLRAATKAGLQHVSAQVKEADDRQVAELAIVENLQRKDLNPLEKAASFQRYLTTYGGTQEELAGRLKINRSTVANLIRLLELPEEVQQALHTGGISQGHARALLPLGEEQEQIAFAKRIFVEQLSVRETESQVKEMIEQADSDPLSRDTSDSEKPAPKPPTASEHLQSLEQQFRTALGAKVSIRQSAKGRGRIVINFANHAEFERLLAHICPSEQPQTEAKAA